MIEHAPIVNNVDAITVSWVKFNLDTNWFWIIGVAIIITIQFNTK